MAKADTEKLMREPMPRLLLSTCSQTVMSVMLFSLYSLADTFFVARGVGAYAAGAVALSAPVVQIIGAFASTVGSGGASIISRALGKKDTEKAAQTAANTFLLFWISALVFSLIGLVLLEPLLRLLAADEILMPYAKGYTGIILIGAVTATGFSSLIRAEGNIRYSIYQWAIPSLVNLALDPLFIFVLKMGVEGAALATVLAQVVSTCLSMYYFFLSKGHYYKIEARHFRVQPRLMGEVLLIGSPALLSQLCSSGLLVAVNHRIGMLGGAAALSAFGIVGRLKSFMFMPISGIVQGLQPIVGFNYSAGRRDRVKEAIKLSLGASVIFGSVCLLLCLIIPNELMGAFVREPEVVELGSSILRILAISLPFMGGLTIVSSYFQSTGKAALAFALPVVSVLFISLPLLYIFSYLWGISGIWFSYITADIAAFSISLIFLHRSINIKNKGELR